MSTTSIISEYPLHHIGSNIFYNLYKLNCYQQHLCVKTNAESFIIIFPKCKSYLLIIPSIELLESILNCFVKI